MSSEFAIKVTRLSKCYQIYQQPIDRLKQGLYRLFARFLPSPYLKQVLNRRAMSYAKPYWALHEVSFELEKGGCFGIIGRNGSGKSTLLQLLCGTLNPTDGEIQVNGRVAALLELGSGFNPEYTGRENIYMNGQLLGLSRQQVDERIEKIIAFADIGDFIEQPVKTYSSGMFVRVAFAVIAHVDADILVIDEALAVGDAFFTQKCMRFLRDFMATGTVLFVSHDTGAVKSLCENALWLEKGHMQQIGSAKEVSENYLEAFYESFQHVNKKPQKTQVLKTIPDSDFSNRTDARAAWINRSKWRNDIELFEFNENAKSFGNGYAKIIRVELHTIDMTPLSWIVGGEQVVMSVTANVMQNIDSPIIGFYIKDRLGQVLFGDNTYLTYCDDALSVKADTEISAQFHFHMPFLPKGEYSVCVAIAMGSNESHVQLEWIHDAMILRSESSHITTGLVGIPMQKIEISIAPETQYVEIN